MREILPTDAIIRANKTCLKSWTSGPECAKFEVRNTSLKLQEAVSSTRRVFFSTEQAFFECYCTQRSETMPFWPTAKRMREDVIRVWDRDQFAIRPIARNRQLHDLCGLLRLYFSRDMIYQKDAFNAFAGILQRFNQGAEPIKTLHGIPISNHALGYTYSTSQHSALEVSKKNLIAGLLRTATNATRRREMPCLVLAWMAR